MVLEVLRGNLRLLVPVKGEVLAATSGDVGRTAFYSPGPATDAEMYTFVLRRAPRCGGSERRHGTNSIAASEPLAEAAGGAARQSKTPQGDFPNRAFTFDIPKRGPGRPIDN